MQVQDVYGEFLQLLDTKDRLSARQKKETEDAITNGLRVAMARESSLRTRWSAIMTSVSERIGDIQSDDSFLQPGEDGFVEPNGSINIPERYLRWAASFERACGEQGLYGVKPAVTATRRAGNRAGKSAQAPVVQHREDARDPEVVQRGLLKIISAAKRHLKADELLLNHCHAEIAAHSYTATISGALTIGPDSAQIEQCIHEFTMGNLLISSTKEQHHSVAGARQLLQMCESQKNLGAWMAAWAQLEGLFRAAANTKVAHKLKGELNTLFEEGKRLGSSLAGMQQGAMIMEEGSHQCKRRALPCYRHSAELGNPIAMYKTAWLEAEVAGCELDSLDAPTSAVAWAERAADAGNPFALNIRGNRLSHQGKDEEALEAYRAAAARGDSLAMTELAKQAVGEDNFADVATQLWQVIASGPMDDAYAMACFLLACTFMDLEDNGDCDREKALMLLGRGAACANPCESCTSFLPRVLQKRRRCNNCQQLEYETKFKCCSRCKVSYYCNTGCSKAHWKQHKRVCSPSWPQSELLAAAKSRVQLLKGLTQDNSARVEARVAKSFGVGTSDGALNKNSEQRHTELAPSQAAACAVDSGKPCPSARGRAGERCEPCPPGLTWERELATDANSCKTHPSSDFRDVKLSSMSGVQLIAACKSSTFTSVRGSPLPFNAESPATVRNTELEALKPLYTEVLTNRDTFARLWALVVCEGAGAADGAAARPEQNSHPALCGAHS